MVRKAKVLRKFLEDTPLKKTETGEHIIQETGDHPLVFVTPDPTVGELTSINDELKAKTLAALSGDTELIEARNACEKVWVEKFSKNCDYTDRVANGNVLIITQAGHKASKTEISPKEKTGQPIIKAVKGDYTVKGKVDIECEALPDAEFYFAIATQQPLDLKVKNSQALMLPQGEMGMTISTKRKFSIEELQSGTQYQIIVIGFNTAGFGPKSQPAFVVVP